MTLMMHGQPTRAGRHPNPARSQTSGPRSGCPRTRLTEAAVDLFEKQDLGAKSVTQQALGAATAVLLRLAFESWLESNQSERLRQSAEKYLKALCPYAGRATCSIV
jgi:hypothetical protein